MRPDERRRRGRKPASVEQPTHGCIADGEKGGGLYERSEPWDKLQAGSVLQQSFDLMVRFQRQHVAIQKFASQILDFLAALLRESLSL